MPREVRERLADILESIQTCQVFIQGMGFAEFVADEKTRAAVTYELIVLGEAVRALPAGFKQSHPDLPWDKMQAVRNIAVHEYFRIDPGVLWHIVTQNLPPLQGALQKLLEESQP